MIVLSHRGYWKSDEEKNTAVSFKRSFSYGYGTETDIRDFQGELVISHDIPENNCLSAREFFEIYCQFDMNLPLALNIKSDGLQIKLKKLLEEYQINNYFVFDMSIPDGLQYLKSYINVFTRQSEYEHIPSFYEAAQGVWLDEFQNHWISEDVIREHIQANKRVCIVSPDLHKRDYVKEWAEYKNIDKKLVEEYGVDLTICTDFPEEARGFFNE